MRVEIPMNIIHPTVNTVNISSQSVVNRVGTSYPSSSTVDPDSAYISLNSESKICVAKFWVIKRGLTAATGLGIAAWGVVGFGGVLSLLLNPEYDACIDVAIGMICVGVSLSVACAILYTKAINYCRRQELSVSHLARRLAMGEGGAPALVALNHLQRPLQVMAPVEIIAKTRDRGSSSEHRLPLLQFSRGMTLKYGCMGRDGKNATVYLPDPNAPIDKYPNLKVSVIASISCFFVGITIITTFLIIWVSAYPYDRQTMLVSTVLDIVGGIMAVIGAGLGVYVYTLCLKYEMEDDTHNSNSGYTNPIMTIF